jgi:hypothetical protein
MTSLRILLIVIPLAGLLGANPRQTPDPDFTTLLQRVRERVMQHYLDLRSLAWTNTTRRETLDEKGTAREKSRELSYESIIRFQEPSPEDTGIPFYIRDQSELRLIDGKQVKKKESPESSDPRPVNLGELLFLLLKDSRALNYELSYGGSADLDGRKTLRIEVHSPQKTPPQVSWDKSFVFFGVRYEFKVTGIKYNQGTLWIDPETYDVLRLDWRSDPFEFQRDKDSRKIRYEQQMTARYQAVPFTNPEQTVVVPVSAELVTAIRGIKVSIHRTLYSFSNYKRFTGDARVLAIEGEKR